MTIETITLDGEEFEFARVENDVNGNPRYVVHWTVLESPAERDALRKQYTLLERHAAAVKRANSIGGRKYRSKAYGGGIGFQSYSLDELARAIVRARSAAALPA